MDTSINDKQDLETCFENEVQTLLATVGMERMMTYLTVAAQRVDDGPAEILLRAAKIAYVECLEEGFLHQKPEYYHG